MMRMLQQKGGARDKYWFVNCPHCFKEHCWYGVSPVYCEKCCEELPPWYLMHMDDPTARVEYHFTGEI